MQKRMCVVVDETMLTENGYLPHMVTEGVSGMVPLSGNGDHASPWYWGDDLEKAKKIAADYNTRLGLTEEDVTAIRASSFAAGEVR